MRGKLTITVPLVTSHVIGYWPLHYIVMFIRMFDIQYWKCSNIWNAWKIKKGKTKNLYVVYLTKHINGYFQCTKSVLS